MELRDFFPMWDKLDNAHQQALAGGMQQRSVEKGEIIHSGDMDCTGLYLVASGQLRAYILSEDGREISIYRLFQRDICLFSASCIMRSIQFQITIQAEKDSLLYIIPAELYKKLMEQSAPLANYTNEIMASRFSEVMWLIEQILWKSFDKRLAAYLLEESALEGSLELTTTHELIARHLGSAREVVTRMLRYFQGEGMVKLSRGLILLSDPAALERLRDS